MGMSEAVRAAVLERMRENLKLEPGEAEKLTKQLEQGKEKDQDQDRGMRF